MTRTEVIKAMKQLGGIATRAEIEITVGANQQHVIGRMVKWHELFRKKTTDKGDHYYIYTLNECLE